MAETAVHQLYTDAPHRHRVDATMEGYQPFFNRPEATERKSGYAKMTNAFYDLVTDFYEYGWGQSFHFPTLREGESLATGLTRYQHYLALKLGLKGGDKVLDIGCGVGGPMREIAAFSGAHVTGLNNNAYQLDRSRRHTREARLESLIDHCKGDFMALPFADGCFDAAYEVEATCHAPDKAACYREIARVLKSGGLFAGYEWCTTDAYEPHDPIHRQLKFDIEQGNSLPELATMEQIGSFLREAGFEVLEAHDRALACDPASPWYSPLDGSLAFKGFRRSGPGRIATQASVNALETLRIAPKGSAKVSRFLNQAAVDLVRAGKRGIFTPSYFFLARKA